MEVPSRSSFRGAGAGLLERRPVGHSAAIRSAALEPLSERVQQGAHALLAPGGRLMTEANSRSSVLGRDVLDVFHGDDDEC